MIAVNTSLALAKKLHENGSINNFADNHDYESLQEWLEINKATLTPTFPGIHDESMQTYFQLNTPATLSAKDLNQFLHLPGIEAAYEKPMDELPG